MSSLLPLIKAGSWPGVWAPAGVTAPTVKPPANAAPLFRNPLRSGRFEPMGLSFADDAARNPLIRVESIRPSHGDVLELHSAVEPVDGTFDRLRSACHEMPWRSGH